MYFFGNNTWSQLHGTLCNALPHIYRRGDMQLYRALLELLASKPANTRGDGSVVFIQMQESGDNI